MSLGLAKNEHQRLVMKSMDYFESMRLIVTCDCSGYVDCEKIKCFEPDVRAFDKPTGLCYIGEAKTCDALKSDHTKKQFLEFLNRITTKGKSNGMDVQFYIMVPENYKSHLHHVLAELDLLERKNIHILI